MLACLLIVASCTALDDLYARLGVNRTATAPEIRKAYHRRALATHPDTADDKEDAQQQFVAVAEAYEVLGNHERRAEYDRTGASSSSRGGGAERGHGYEEDDLFSKPGWWWMEQAFDAFSVRLAQQRAFRLSSMSELRHALQATGDHGRRHGLIAFYQDAAHLRQVLKFPVLLMRFEPTAHTLNAKIPTAPSASLLEPASTVPICRLERSSRCVWLLVGRRAADLPGSPHTRHEQRACRSLWHLCRRSAACRTVSSPPRGGCLLMSRDPSLSKKQKRATSADSSEIEPMEGQGP